MRTKKIIILPAMMLMLAARAAHANVTSTTTTSKEPRVLVAYFSMQDGNTGDIARAIVDATGGDLY